MKTHHRQFLLLIGRLKKIDWLAGSGDGLVFVLPIKLMQISIDWFTME
jgi:hypothetical protein